MRPSQLHVTAHTKNYEVGTVTLVSTNDAYYAYYADDPLVTGDQPEQQIKHRRATTGATGVANNPLDVCGAQMTSRKATLYISTNEQDTSGSNRKCKAGCSEDPLIKNKNGQSRERKKRVGKSKEAKREQNCAKAKHQINEGIVLTESLKHPFNINDDLIDKVK